MARQLVGLGRLDAVAPERQVRDAGLGGLRGDVVAGLESAQLVPKAEAVPEQDRGDGDRILRRVRASLLRDIGPEELAITFETLQRIEQRASRLQDVKTGPETK